MGVCLLKYGVSRIRGGHLLIGILKTWNLANVLKSISAQFSCLNVDVLIEQFDAICAQSKETQQAAAAADTPAGTVPAAQGTLAQYGQDPTARAREGKIDPVVGRDEEIRQMVDILIRRRQNNPLLTGEAGVGKTAVVEGLALRIAEGDVPAPLQNIQLWLLDIGMLQAGAGMKGEFEARLQALINEVQSSATPVILFIDEIHTLIGAGGQQGTGDAANLLKPALARGQLRTIGATTWAEYKNTSKDPALTRRFQTVQVHEPDEAKAILMLRSTVSPLETHHQVLLLDEAVSAAVKLSHRYIPARQLPDKAVALLDTACARVAVSQSAPPAQLEDCLRHLAALDVEIEIAGREARVGAGDPERVAALTAERDTYETKREALTQRWEEERALVTEIIRLRAALFAAGDDETGELRSALNAQQQALNALQGDEPLLFAAVDENVVAAVVSDWTGIPLGRMVKNEIDAVLNLADTLNQRVIGQRHGLDLIARRVKPRGQNSTIRNKPVGVFMLCGPSGVGKTETALALAESLYGGEQNVITINMSEFQEAHTVSTLKGAPPGYVGYGEGGVLTEAVRRRPYSVVLLDEIEKAHPDVHEIFFQVFDKGWMEDGEGRHIDFRNTIIILTSNVGTDLISAMCADPELMPEPEALSGALRQPLLEVFPPALLGRLLVVPYYPLSDEMLGQIVRLQLKRIQRRLQENHNIISEFDDSVVEQIVQRCTEVESGGRMVDAILTNTLLPQMSQILLTASRSDEQYRRLHVTCEQGEFHCQFAA